MIQDKELVDRVLGGDVYAEEDFYKLYHPRLYRTAVYFLGIQDPEAEDVVQETFLIALSKMKDFDFRAPLYAWMRQICVHLCYQRLRNRKRVLVSIEEDMEVFTQKVVAERMREHSHEEEKQFKLDLLEKLKTQLDETSRQILQLRDSRGESYSEISRILDIPMGTVMSRLARSREALKKLVKNFLEEKGLPERTAPKKTRAKQS